MQLTVLLPGLCPPPGLDWPVAMPPALSGLLARAQRDDDAVPTDLLAMLAALFALDVTQTPWAALGYAGDTGRIAEGFVLSLDPVHLRLGMTDAIVQGGDALGVRLDEAHRLAGDVQAYFAAHGWRIECASATRWYLHLPRSCDLRCTPLPSVIGRDAGLFKPQGADAARWLADLTEAQMLLHAHPLNQQREARGQLTINHLWTWGGGVWPQARVHSAFDAVLADQAQARGLGLAQGVAVDDVAECCADWMEASAGRHTLLVLDDLIQPMQMGDVEDWQACLQGMEARWFAPLQRALHRGRLRAVHVHSAGKRFTCQRLDGLRIWRRTPSLSGLCARSA